jgi:hypothetical protein
VALRIQALIHESAAQEIPTRLYRLAAPELIMCGRLSRVVTFRKSPWDFVVEEGEVLCFIWRHQDLHQIRLGKNGMGGNAMPARCPA